MKGNLFKLVVLLGFGIIGIHSLGIVSVDSRVIEFLIIGTYFYNAFLVFAIFVFLVLGIVYKYAEANNKLKEIDSSKLDISSKPLSILVNIVVISSSVLSEGYFTAIALIIVWIISKSVTKAIVNAKKGEEDEQ